MKSRKAAFAAWVCVCLCLALAGVVPAFAEAGDAIHIVPVIAKDLERPEYYPGPGRSQANIVADGANAFAFRLSAALAKKTGDKNLVCSPYSVRIPLAALGAAGVDEEALNRAASRMLYGRDKSYRQIMRLMECSLDDPVMAQAPNVKPPLIARIGGGSSAHVSFFLRDNKFPVYPPGIFPAIIDNFTPYFAFIPL